MNRTGLSGGKWIYIVTITEPIGTTELAFEDFDEAMRAVNICNGSKKQARWKRYDLFDSFDYVLMSGIV